MCVLNIRSYIYLYTLGYHEDAEWSTVSCFLYDLLSVTVPQIFHTASNWLTLGILIYRHPVSNLFFCSPGGAAVHLCLPRCSGKTVVHSCEVTDVRFCCFGFWVLL